MSVLTAMMAVILLGERVTVVRWVSFGLSITGVLYRFGHRLDISCDL
jgi:hypothetical protein